MFWGSSSLDGTSMLLLLNLPFRPETFLALGDLDDHVVHGVSQLVHVLEHGLALLILGDVGNCDLHAS